VAAIVVAAWASGGAEANDKATMVASTRAPDVADNLPRNWRDGSCRIIAETVAMAATDDMVPEVEAWEQTWAGDDPQGRTYGCRLALERTPFGSGNR
jgi:hypothetical protein